MDINEVVHYIRNEMPDYKWDEAANALTDAFDRTHPGVALGMVALPKFDLEERKRILDCAFRCFMEGTYDEVTGAPLIPKRSKNISAK